MSKRFGRNQKRRMRAEIAALAERARTAEYDKWLESRRNVEARQAVNDTARVLGRFFPTLPWNTVELTHLNQLFDRHRAPKMSSLPEHFCPYEQPEELLMETVAVMECSPLLVEEVRGHFGEARCFRVLKAGRPIAALGLEDKTYRAMPRAMVARMIGEKLGEFIANRETLHG